MPLWEFDQLGVRSLAMTYADQQGAAQNQGRPELAAGSWGRETLASSQQPLGTLSEQEFHVLGGL